MTITPKKMITEGETVEVKETTGQRGGVDDAIHRVAGCELYKACLKVLEVRPGVRCPTGEARITPGFNEEELLRLQWSVDSGQKGDK